MQVNGFSYNEFACPVCKSINNSLIPYFPIDEVMENKGSISSYQQKQLADFYIDFFSEIIKNRIGERFDSSEPKQVLLSDVMNEPHEFISKVIDHFCHTIYLTDIKGL
jgi:phage FluMu protein Com